MVLSSKKVLQLPARSLGALVYDVEWDSEDQTMFLTHIASLVGCENIASMHTATLWSCKGAGFKSKVEVAFSDNSGSCNSNAPAFQGDVCIFAFTINEQPGAQDFSLYEDVEAFLTIPIIMKALELYQKHLALYNTYAQNVFALRQAAAKLPHRKDIALHRPWRKDASI